MDKPFAPACERNRDPILAVLREYLPHCASVLEIGSGTGQHAVYFAGAFAHLRWQPSDRPRNLPGIAMWLEEAALPNMRVPIALDVNDPWPGERFDAVFTANTLHIMAWTDVVRLFEHLPGVLAPRGYFIAYGPFSYGGRHTSESNAAFDANLRASVPTQGIRDFEAVDRLARGAGLELVRDHAMPANNRTLVWRRPS